MHSRRSSFWPPPLPQIVDSERARCSRTGITASTAGVAAGYGATILQRCRADVEGPISRMWERDVRDASWAPYFGGAANKTHLGGLASRPFRMCTAVLNHFCR